MRKRSYAALGICMAALLLSAPVSAGKITPEQLAAMDAVTNNMLNEEAVYWSWRIQYVSDYSYDALYNNSERWVMGEETRKNLFERIKHLLESGEARPPTDAEMDKYTAGKDKIRAMLTGDTRTFAQRNPRAAARAERNARLDAIRKGVMEIESRYWAWRIDVLKDITYAELKANSKNWIGRDEVTSELLRKIDERLKSGPTEKLTDEERKKLDDAHAARKAILNERSAG